MNLTKTERLILANQYRILEILVPVEADDYRQKHDIVRQGYAGHYSQLDQWFYEEMSVERCSEIRQILDMFRALTNARTRGLEVSGDKLAFVGFDGNDEGEEFGYVTFLVETLHRWDELKTSDLNSHWPMLPRYRAMVSAWEASGEKFELTQQDIDRIAAAAEEA